MAMSVGTNSLMYRMLSTINRLETERATTMARLSTGNRINQASDDPAGLIALNSMNAELAAINAALDNGQRSQSMLNVADSTLTEVSALTAEIERLAVAAQGSTVTTEEKAAYQAQIDSSVDAIDRLINQAEFNGEKIFNGENRIRAVTDSQTSIKDVNVYSRDPSQTSDLTLNISVTAAAAYAYQASATAGSSVTLSAETVIQVTGKLGTATITLANGSTSAAVRSAINAQKQVTGVSAIVGTGTTKKLIFASTEKGSDAFVSVSKISGADNVVNCNKTSGTDATVTVNGETANADGTEVFYNGNGVSMSFNLAVDTVATHTITVNGGGATFQLGTDTTTRAALGLAGVNAQELGRSDLGYLTSMKSGGSNCLTATSSKATQIAREANNQVATAAARIGSFNKYQVGSTISALTAAKEGLTDAADAIGKTDYALETAALDRQNVLMNAAVSMLSVASAQQANVLALLQ